MSETDKKSRKLLPARFKQSQFATNRWTAIAEAGTSFDEIATVPSYWAHITSGVKGKLKPCDTIEVWTDDMTFYAELLVLAVGNMEAVVVPKPGYPMKLVVPTGLTVEEVYIHYAGPHHKYRIARVSDNQPVEFGFASEPEALAAATRSGRKIVPKPEKAAA